MVFTVFHLGMLPDEFGALARAKEQIQMVKKGTLKLKDYKDKHHNRISTATKGSSPDQANSNVTVDMKGKGEEYDYSYISSKITPTSTIKVIQDKVRL